jgi:tRNA threonylcarbamoyladenosine biosynthesis protein TsaB
MSDSNYILAIECAVANGSVALLHGRELIGPSVEGNPSRAEDILRIIDSVLDSAGIPGRELSTIAVSTGPGSYSGIRIGLATALGLASATGVPCTGVATLEAMASRIDRSSIDAVTAVPVGKNQVAWQVFESSEGGASDASPPELASFATFVELLSSRSSATLLAHTDVYTRLSGDLPTGLTLIDAGTNLAGLIAQFVGSHPSDSGSSLKPLYLRDRSLGPNPIER